MVNGRPNALTRVLGRALSRYTESVKILGYDDVVLHRSVKALGHGDAVLHEERQGSWA